MKKIALFVFLLVFSPSFSGVSAAQAAQVKIYTTLDGLAGNVITAVAFEPNGSAWIGTSEGATHISNAGWVSYVQAHGLGDSFITSIAVAPDGRIWFGTQSGGLSVLNPQAKTFQTYSLDNSKIPSNFVTALAVSQDNVVWVGTLDQGVAQFDPKTDTWTRFAEPGSQITAISLESDGEPWVGTPKGVWFGTQHGWESRRTGDGNVKRIDAFGGEWYLTTDEIHFRLLGDTWVPTNGKDEITTALAAAKLTEGQITAFAKDEQQRYWFGTPRGIFMVNNGNAPTPPAPLPVVLIHGWTVGSADTLETSEFRFLKSYADRDGIPMYYLRGIKPQNTLYQNAVVIRDEIARVKKETGASKVNMVAFSMGGMNTRAYLESSLYADDVNRAIILGTPQAGVEVWKPILFQQILDKPDQPSAIELSPEYAQMIVNETRAPNPTVPYDLLIGDARQQSGLDFLSGMPASDALISVNSALALDAPNVRQHIDSDLHDWSPEAVPIDLTGYLYPRQTWDRYLRNALRNNDNAPIGSEITSPSLPSPVGKGVGGEGLAAFLPPPVGTGTGGEGLANAPSPSNHTPVISTTLNAGDSITQTVQVDANTSARFVSYYPGGKIDFSLIAPDGKTFEPSDLPRDDGSGVLSLSTDVASFSGYVVKNAAVGTWQMILKRTDSGAQPLKVSTYLELQTPLSLQTFLRSQTLALGKTNTLTAYMTATPDSPVPPAHISATVAQPGASAGAPYILTKLDLFDDGQHDDGAANDGSYAGQFTPTRAGWHLVFVQAQGSGFARETEMAFAVSPNDAHFTAPGILTKENKTWNLHVPINAARAGAYALSLVVHQRTDDAVITRQFFPLTLQSGDQISSLALDFSKIPAGAYTLDVILLDANGAAVELARAPAPIPFIQP